ncbi:tRNA (adenosine(37)-N6)-threonylcarbamoyltransferase complex dimerization subunit type 1 TsaB [Alcanivorax sp. 1008]|uniref:tRNA (adenosine(37)-N6)-threonylcarbamoyltransferase complex dimerization subunit type 1 TsaB n=1 Tax=Alcanivorax sp. 1008 TaxID=2816853 RepID=UPI001E11B7E8|nr:tRNA (adenosine(37)-N6)-threonylcarbamoyltransferase complex dimerization subunit type 1 TsaB [Alcanivorax sp. 1008]MCC1495630.1 tRNA (adenosine(37)-N6)-threonylcarbamoyltransferase complex dimerization subunit type 1 TsaB [Alcanivorax sp. 1008]
MKLLAIETATDSCSVALWHNGEVREHFEAAARRQTERVLPMVEALLAEAGWKLGELDAIGFGHGPGAFTGVRVAVSVAQGLGFAADLPVIGISTLAAAAHTAAGKYGDGDWLIAFDARMSELYLAGYRCHQGVLEVLLQDCLAAPTQLPSLPAGEWRGAGSGELYLSALRAAWPMLGDWQAELLPRASSVAALAAQQRAQGAGVVAEQARPVYLRDRVIQGAIR